MPNLRKRTKVTCSHCGMIFSMNSGELAGWRKKSKSGLTFHSRACYQDWLKEYNRTLVNNPSGVNQYSKGKGIV